MAISNKKQFEPVQLGTSASTLFTVSAAPATTVFKGGMIRFSNNSGASVTVTGYAVPVGGSASDTNAFVKAKTIAANDYLDMPIPKMKAGDFLQALASAASSISSHILSGEEFS